MIFKVVLSTTGGTQPLDPGVETYNNHSHQLLLPPVVSPGGNRTLQLAGCRCDSGSGDDKMRHPRRQKHKLSAV